MASERPGLARTTDGRCSVTLPPVIRGDRRRPLPVIPLSFPMQSPVGHVVVVGAGLAGLSAAEAIASRTGGAGGPPRLTVVDPASRPGGLLGTVHRDGWLVERSADSFLASRPEAVDLVGRIGLSPSLVGVNERMRRALVWHAGRAVPVPRGFRLMAPGSLRGVLTTPLLPPWARLRVLLERFVPRGHGEDESLEHFAVRRLGREAFERLVQPLASGIWTADPTRLSMAAACPDFLAMEREHGSLWAGERARLRSTVGGTAAGARYGQFLTLSEGMESLPMRLADVLRGRGVRFLTAAARELSRGAGGGWQVAITETGSGETALHADAVVVATPAPMAARLVGGFDQVLAADLAAIEYAGSAIVSLGFARHAVRHPLDAAGLVVPRTARRPVLAASFSSSKFPGRAPEGCVLIRVFVGGALDPAAMELDDAALVMRVRDEMARMFGATGTPSLVQVDRWPASMPQYHVGHVDRVSRIEAAVARHPGLALAGAAYRGVGIPQVIASGRAAADRVA